MRVSRGPRARRLYLPFLLPILPLLFYACTGSGSASAGRGTSGGIEHVVLCWLKNPGSQEDRNRLIASATELETIPGVISVSAGPPLPSDRTVVDDSFDVGFVIVLKDSAALSAYLTHPTHLAAVRNILAPLVARTLIYDIVGNQNEELRMQN